MGIDDQKQASYLCICRDNKVGKNYQSLGVIHMKKLLLVAASLLFMSANALAANVNMTLTGVVSQSDMQFLNDALGEELTTELVALVKDGHEVSVSFDYSSELDPRDPPECSVKIRETTKGGGGGSVDVGKGKGRVGGAEVKGGGETTRDIEVKGPCKEVRDIIRDIRNNKP